MKSRFRDGTFMKLSLEDFIRESRGVREASEALGIRSIEVVDGLIIYSIIYVYASKLNSNMKALDAGAGVGYSTLWIARAIEDSTCKSGEVIGLELEPERYERALEIMSRWSFNKVKISFLNVEASSYIDRLDDCSIDLAFIDVAKRLYPKILNLLEYKLKPGGIALFHNAIHPPPPLEFLEESRRSPWSSTIIPTASGGLLVAIRSH